MLLKMAGGRPPASASLSGRCAMPTITTNTAIQKERTFPLNVFKLRCRPHENEDGWTSCQVWRLVMEGSYPYRRCMYSKKDRSRCMGICRRHYNVHRLGISRDHYNNCSHMRVHGIIEA